MSYSTKQRDLLLEKIKSMKTEFTIKEIYEKMNNNVGLTTVYRLVDKLVKEGYIKKNISDDNITYYEYFDKCSEENHFYLKCDLCKKLEHIDCDCIDELYEHINKKHHFKLNKENIVINGICRECANE